MEKENYLVSNDATFLGILGSLPVAVIINNPDFSIRHVNAAFTALTGFELMDVVGKEAPYPWWPEARHQEYLDELSLAKQGKQHKSDWLFRARDGHQFWIKANVKPVLRDGKVQYMIACWTDITENKKVEEELRRKGGE